VEWFDDENDDDFDGYDCVKCFDGNNTVVHVILEDWKKRRERGELLMLVEIEYGYRYVLHVADAIIVDVSIRIPV
jgi:hypothetical protein